MATIVQVIDKCSSKVKLDPSKIEEIGNEFKKLIEAGDLSAAGLETMETILDSIKPIMDTTAACLDGLLNLNRGIPWIEAFSLSVSVSAGMAFTGSGEMGMAVETTGKWRKLGFIGGCSGIKTDTSIGIEVDFGFWRHLDDIPGKSLGAGLGFDLFPGTEIGAGVSLVSNGTDLTGVVFSVGAGFGLSPVDFTFVYCNTPITLNGCTDEKYIGDGECDDTNNTKECKYDGGDCCNHEAEYWNNSCVECECLDPEAKK